MTLPETGLKIVLDGMDKAVKQISAFDKESKNFVNSMNDMADGMDQIAKVSGKTDGSMAKAASTFRDAGKQISKLSSEVDTALSAFDGLVDVGSRVKQAIPTKNVKEFGEESEKASKNADMLAKAMGGIAQNQMAKSEGGFGILKLVSNIMRLVTVVGLLRKVSRFLPDFFNLFKNLQIGGLGGAGGLAGAATAANSFSNAIGLSIPKLMLFNNTAGRIPGIGGMLAKGISFVAKNFKMLAIAGGLAAAAVIAFNIAVKPLIALGQRGADIEVLAQAFGNTVQGLADSTEILHGLRAATRGTISDVELMALANKALQGSSTELRQELLQTTDGVSNLGKVLDVTARAAKATGQSQEIIQEKFLTGLRLMSKKRLDDIGVTVDATKANEAYAKSIGKTVDQLTEAEKQAAFTREAIRQLDRIGQEAGGINSLPELFSRISATIANMKDQLAVAILPVFKPLAGIVAEVVTVIGDGFKFVAIIIQSFANVLGGLITTIVNVAKFAHFLIMNFTPLGVMFKIVGAVVVNVIAIFKIIGQVVQAVANSIGSALASLREKLGPFADAIDGTINKLTTDVAFNAARGGAIIIGAFAVGMLKAGTLVAQAAAEIAGIVADFLEGFSPPKKGPLKDIDKGGLNVAKAWVDGFMGGIKDDISVPIEFVKARLGDIANFSRGQVEAAFARLDAALLPFQERLDIVRADMEAMAGFANPAIKIMEKRIADAIKSGDVSSEQVQFLDQQIMRLKQIQNMEQRRVDESELQLALAKSQQAQERALLGIQKARLGVAQAGSGSAKAEEKAKEKAAKSAKKGDLKEGMGKGGETPSEEGATTPFVTGDAPDILSNEAVDAAVANLKAGFEAGLSDVGFDAALSEFAGSTGELESNMARIAASDPVQGIADKFTGLGDALSDALSGVGDVFSSVFDPIKGLLDDIGISVEDLTIDFELMSGLQLFTLGVDIRDIAEAINNLITKADLSIPSLDDIKEAIDGILPDNIQDLYQAFLGLQPLLLPFSIALSFIKDNFDAMAEKLGTINIDLGSFVNSIDDLVPDDLESISQSFLDIDPIIGGIKDAMEDIKDAINGISIPPGLMDLLDTMMSISTLGLSDAFGGLRNAISGIAGSLGLGGGGDGESSQVFAGLQALVSGEGGEGGGVITPEQVIELTEILAMFQEGGVLDLALQRTQEQFTMMFGEDGTLREPLVSFADFVALLFEDIGDSINGIEDDMSLTAMNIETMLAQLIARFQEFVSTQVPAAFELLGAVLYRSVFVPFGNAANALISAMNDSITELVDAYNRTYGATLGRIPQWRGARTLNLSEYLPQLATGAVGFKGSAIVGERGPELITTGSSRVNVFPHAATRALQEIAATPIYAGFGGAGYHDSSQVNNTTSNVTNFNVERARDAFLLRRQMAARGLS